MKVTELQETLQPVRRLLYTCPKLHFTPTTAECRSHPGMAPVSQCPCASPTTTSSHCEPVG